MGSKAILLSLSSIGILIFGLSSCPTMSEAQADELNDSVATHPSFIVQPVISLALQPTVNVDLVPQSNGSFGATTAKLSVSTNSAEGYSLYMSTVDGSPNLKNSDISQSSFIGPTTAGVNQQNFATNTWGYSLDTLDNKTYYPVPTSTDNAIKQVSTGSLKDTYDLTFAASVDTSIASGTYTNAVIVSAIANPVTISSLSQLVYMQNMTSEICANTAEGVSKQLIDTRDGNTYWVEKLKDGHCWMTQNLALNLTEAGLSPLDSDISDEWNSRSTYPPQATNQIALNGTHNSYTRLDTNSWSWGKVVLAMPEAGSACGKSIYSSDNIGEVCAEVGFVDVSGDDWKPTFTAKQGTFVRPSGLNYNGLIAVDQATKTYDAHYLIGNYYQYNTAVAGTGNIAEGADAPESICPKGWRMPNGVADASGSRFHLLKTYGLANRGQYGDSGSISAGNYNIAAAPLYFVRSGYTLQYQSVASGLGQWGTMWSSTLASGGNGVMLEFSNKALTPARSSYTGAGGGYNDGATGEPIRCRARD